VALIRAAVYIWSAPYGLVGLAAAALFAALGWLDASAWCNGALQVLVQGPVADWMNRRGWAATTIGWAIFYWRPSNKSWSTMPSSVTQRHEERHVHQVLLLGVLFLPVYGMLWLTLFLRALLSSLIAGDWRRHHFRDVLAIAATRAYEDNPLERDARKAAARQVRAGTPPP
jgi:hypothetical protein